MLITIKVCLRLNPFICLLRSKYARTWKDSFGGVESNAWMDWTSGHRLTQGRDLAGHEARARKKCGVLSHVHIYLLIRIKVGVLKGPSRT